MDIEDAWNTFMNPPKDSIKKSSVGNKLDVIASQLNELQTDVSRLADNIPAIQGDEAAMDLASPDIGGAMPPVGEPAMPVEEGDELPPEALASDVGGEEEMVGMDGADSGDELIGEGEMFSDEEIAQILNDVDGGEAVPEGGSNSLVDILKELIAQEDDPVKLAGLAEALRLATESGAELPAEEIVDDMPPVEEMPFLKSADAGDAAEEAVEPKLDDGPEASESFEKVDGIDEDLPQKLAVEIAEIVENILSDALLDAKPEKEKEEDSSNESIPVPDTDDASEECDGKDEECDEKKDDEEKGDEEEDDTKPFAASDSDITPVEKSFRDKMMEKIIRKGGIDGKPFMMPKTEEGIYNSMISKMESRPEHAFYKSDFEDGGGKKITPLEKLEMVRKSDRPFASTTVNGSIDSPDPTRIMKSGAEPHSFRKVMASSDIHEAMRDEWDEYNIFKSRY